MSFLPKAWAGEVLRSAQKDVSFVEELNGKLSELVLNFLGPQTWINYNGLIQDFSRFLYYAITTLSDFQTLGEEYTGIIQLDNTKRAIPSKLKRFVEICLHCFGFKILLKWIKIMESGVSNSTSLSSSEKQSVCQRLKSVINIIEFADKLNMSLFYIRGVYYHLSKRLTGIQYAKLTRGSLDGSSEAYGGTFRLLGYITLANTALSLIIQCGKSLRTRSEETENQSRVVPTGLKCPLCLDVRKVPTCTPCGHIFCWECIFESARLKPECPICRERFENLSRLVPIMNFNRKFCKT